VIRLQNSLQIAFSNFANSDRFRKHPLSVRMAFQRVADWLPPREASWPMIEINTSFANLLRDKAARERGWRFGNYALILVQTLVAEAVTAGKLSKNRIRQVQKLPPPRVHVGNSRRSIKPIRHRISASADSILNDSSTA
jgi:hypothetical protein